MAGFPGAPRWGLTLPLDGVSLADLTDVAAGMHALGYTDFWSSEVDGADGLTPLAAIAGRGVQALLGTAILPVYTRGPAVLAQSAATMAGLAPGRFTLGIGASSPAVVHSWNAIEHVAPYARVRDTLHFLRDALTGGRVDREYETFAVQGFRLQDAPGVPPALYVAALRPGMLRLASRDADGAIINWLSANDISKVREVTGAAAPLVARILVCPSADADKVRTHARRLIAAYLNVPAYAEFQRWLGRGAALAQMWACWQTGDRRGALATIPNDAVDQLFVHGTPQECIDHIRRYVDLGVTVPVLCILPVHDDLREAAVRLAPSSHDTVVAHSWTGPRRSIRRSSGHQLSAPHPWPSP